MSAIEDGQHCEVGPEAASSHSERVARRSLYPAMIAISLAGLAILTANRLQPPERGASQPLGIAEPASRLHSIGADRLYRLREAWHRIGGRNGSPYHPAGDAPGETAGAGMSPPLVEPSAPPASNNQVTRWWGPEATAETQDTPVVRQVTATLTEQNPDTPRNSSRAPAVVAKVTGVSKPAAGWSVVDPLAGVVAFTIPADVPAGDARSIEREPEPPAPRAQTWPPLPDLAAIPAPRELPQPATVTATPTFGAGPPPAPHSGTGEIQSHDSGTTMMPAMPAAETIAPDLPNLALLPVPSDPPSRSPAPPQQPEPVATSAAPPRILPPLTVDPAPLKPVADRIVPVAPEPEQASKRARTATDTTYDARASGGSERGGASSGTRGLSPPKLRAAAVRKPQPSAGVGSYFKPVPNTFSFTGVARNAP